MKVLILKGYQVNKHPLFLSLNGFYHLSHQQQKDKTLTANWKLSSSECLISRDCYWEHITHYPTANIVEVYKIISAEIMHISPLKGKTYAFIINLSKSRTVVLYCCFSDEIITKAATYNLWRLIPETLPFYRSLFNDNKLYYTDITISPVKLSSGSIKHEVEHVEPALLDNALEPNKTLHHQLIIKVEANKLASFPQTSNVTIPLSESMIGDAQIINNTKYYQVLMNFRALDSLDFIVQITDKIKKTLIRNKHLSSVITMFCISLVLTFIVGKTALLLWQQDHLSNEITSEKANSVLSIRLSNNLKKAKIDINNINKHLSEHSPKTQVLRVLKSTINNDNKLEFKTINISPVDMQLQGTVNSAAALLADLSKIKGFYQVQFNSPPATIKNIGERFNINISYDQKIYSNKSNKITP